MQCYLCLVVEESNISDHEIDLLLGFSSIVILEQLWEHLFLPHPPPGSEDLLMVVLHSVQSDEVSLFIEGEIVRRYSAQQQMV